MAARQREEVLNTVLAACIGARGTDASPETILRRGSIKPDVIAKLRGLRCAIEGKVADVLHAKTVVLDDARRRVDQGIAHLAIGVVYPRHLRTTQFARLPEEMNRASLEFTFVTDAGTDQWHVGGISEILSELRRAHDVIVRDDVLQQSVDLLEVGIREVADTLFGSSGTCDRLISILGVGGKPDAATV
jgi:hypothetical protein